MKLYLRHVMLSLIITSLGACSVLPEAEQIQIYHDCKVTKKIADRYAYPAVFQQQTGGTCKERERRALQSVN